MVRGRPLAYGANHVLRSDRHYTDSNVNPAPRNVTLSADGFGGRRDSVSRLLSTDEARATQLRRPSVARALALGVRAWVAEHVVTLTLVTGLLVIVGLVLGTGITGYPAVADDEGTYVAQGWALGHGALSHYTYWYDHPPLGWIQLAFLGRLVGPLVGADPAVAQGRITMLVPALVSAVLLYVLARRLGIRRGFAAAGVLLFALSPLAVSFLRMVYLDNLATPWILAAFVLAASPRGRLWDYAGSAACFAVAILTKETSLLALPGLALAVRQGADRRTRAFCLAAFASLLILVAAEYPLYALLKGELFPGPGHVSLLDAVRFQLSGRASSGSVFTSGSLSHQLVDSWVGLDPWLVGLGVAVSVPALFVRRLRPAALTLVVFTAMALRPGYLPQPYVIGLLPFCSLLLVGVADEIWGRGLRTWDRSIVARRAAVAVAAIALAVASLPGWYRADAYATHTDENSAVQAAERWVVSHVNHRSRVLIDDTLYVDLVQAGFKPQYGAVWFLKLDFTTNLDPAVVRALPQGWRAFDYVISTPVIRSALEQNPTSLQEVRLALAHSRVIKRFGSGSQLVEVRRIVGVGTGSGFIPPARLAHHLVRGGDHGAH
jgi:hypothetical protein